MCAVQCSEDYLMARTDGGEVFLWSILTCQERGSRGGGGDLLSQYPYASPVINEVFVYVCMYMCVCLCVQLFGY